MNKKRIIPILIVLTVIFTILGATFAYWSWQSDNSNKTNITFTIGADFSCGANGGGNIASANLAPASCTNSTYAIQREITTTITNSGSSPVSLDMWLTVNSIDSGLSNTPNFKWALTTDSTSCSSNVVNSGTFYGKSANSTVTLFTEETDAATYYLYIWLDNTETSTITMNKSFSVSLGGSCTNEQPNYIYTANIQDDEDYENSTVFIGQPLSSSITTYTTGGNAITALNTASGGTVNYSTFLRHRIDDGTLWCAESYENGVADGYSICIYQTETECNAGISDFDLYPDDEYTYSCAQNDFTDSVAESYVGFTITEAMATSYSTTYTSYCDDPYFLEDYEFASTSECLASYPALTIGTYYLRGGDNGKSYSKNLAVLNEAFGAASHACKIIEWANEVTCTIPDLYVSITTNGIAEVYSEEGGPGCAVYDYGDAVCGVCGSGSCP